MSHRIHHPSHSRRTPWGVVARHRLALQLLAYVLLTGAALTALIGFHQASVQAQFAERIAEQTAVECITSHSGREAYVTTQLKVVCQDKTTDEEGAAPAPQK
ncbi:hypothetical protein [Arthrobacter sp. 162MFSha1.1]|uniref:hypothetical protein n=1 Tax=Arthrobacter sp. 162MFSha1.1 TaxID=1151119 RepID=UPI00037A831A|nr:hypothetical protein [Arthrobacter sp. 162MFSha1.1]